jgi:alpha-L-rhamnosidase
LLGGQVDLWDTGKILSGTSIQHPYQGTPLASRKRCVWRVRVWDTDDQVTDYSEPATWEMGLLEASDWDAEWIGYPVGWSGRALYFRLDFELTKEVASARAYAAGVGYYDLHLNGAKVGDHVLDPGFTDYARRVLYATHDVTAALHRGKNTIGAIVGNGWYGMPKLLLQLEVDYADGTREVVSTHGERTSVPSSARWKVTSGPILANGVFDGETYDARQERPDWDQPSDQPREQTPDRLTPWHSILPVEPPGGRLVSLYNEPIKIVESLAPLAVTEPAPGIFVFDGGQNLAGWAELRVEGPRDTPVTLRFAESLLPDGRVNQGNLRSALATDTYILKGGGQETWQPRLTYHGFRYIQVEGYPGRPTMASIAIKRIRSAAAPSGSFECDNELVNRIQRLVYQTEAANLHSVPTDCPQRDERMGWMNDLTVRLEESLYNFNLARFYTKFLADVGDTQAADGSITDTAPHKYGKRPADPVSASYLLMPWMLYQHYGDTAAMARHYDGCKAWVDFLASRSKDGILTYGYYGDWSPPAEQAVAGTARSKNTPVPLMSTGYLYLCSDLLARMAGVLGRTADERYYADLARKVSEAFNANFWDETAGGYGSNNQACNSFALSLGIVPEKNIARVVANLADDVARQQGHLTTGNLCTKYLLETLADHGRADLAFQIVTKETYPGWGFMLANGATTLWERWEHLTAGGMNSHNHPMMGSVSAWFYKYLAGIRPDPAVPGFKHIIIQPHVVDGLNWVQASYDSMHGVIRSGWHKDRGALILNVSVPVNTTASVHVPAAFSGTIREGGQPLAFTRSSEGARVVELGSGDYELVAR